MNQLKFELCCACFSLGALTACNQWPESAVDVASSDPAQNDRVVGEWTEGWGEPRPGPLPNTCDAAFSWNGEVPVMTDTETAPGVNLEVDVDGRGEVQMQAALNLPSSSRGQVPSLGVACRGQEQTEGLVGAGCHLTGFESIKRCGQKRETDGGYRAVQWDTGDRLCLGDNQLWTEEENYWQAQVYHPEGRTEDRVMVDRDLAGRILGFKEERRDGSIRLYGYEGEGTFIEGRRSGRNDRLGYMYRLYKKMDRDGYGLEYRYSTIERQTERDQAREIRGAVWSLPESVVWSFREVDGERVQEPEWEVEFVYDTMQDAHVGYVGGFRVGDGGQLSSVTVRSLDDGQRVWTHRLNYTEGGRLETLQKCVAPARAGTEQEVCSAPRVLVYRSEEAPTYSMAGLGVGAGDVRYYPQEPSSWWFYGGLGGGLPMVVGAPHSAFGGRVQTDFAGEERIGRGGAEQDVVDGRVIEVEIEVRDEDQCLSGDWTPYVQEVPWGGSRIVHVNPRTAKWNVLECDPGGECTERRTEVHAGSRYTGEARNGICMVGSAGRGEVRRADLNLDGVEELYIESEDVDPVSKRRHWVWLKPDFEEGLVAVQTDIEVRRYGWADLDGNGVLEQVQLVGELVETVQLQMPQAEGGSWKGSERVYESTRVGVLEGGKLTGDLNGDGVADLYDIECGEDEDIAEVGSARGEGVLEVRPTDFRVCPQKFTGMLSEEVNENYGNGENETDGHWVYNPHVIHLNDDGYPDMVRLAGQGAQSIEAQFQLGDGRVSDWVLLTGPDVDQQPEQPGRVQFELFGNGASARIQSFKEGFVGSYEGKIGLWLPGKNAQDNGEWHVLVAERETVRVVRTGIPYRRNDDANLPDDVDFRVAENLGNNGSSIRAWKWWRQQIVRKLAVLDMDGDGLSDVHMVMRNEGDHVVFYQDRKTHAFVESYVDLRVAPGQGAFAPGDKQDWVEIRYGRARGSKRRPNEVVDVPGGSPLGGQVVQRQQFLEQGQEAPIGERQFHGEGNNPRGPALYQPWQANAESHNAGVVPIRGEGLELVRAIVQHTGIVDAQDEPVVSETTYQWGGMGMHLGTRKLVLPRWQKSEENLSGRVSFLRRERQLESLRGENIFEGAQGKLVFGAVPTYQRQSQRIGEQMVLLSEIRNTGWVHRSRWGGRAGRLELWGQETLSYLTDGPRAGQPHHKMESNWVYGGEGEVISEEVNQYSLEEDGQETHLHRNFTLNLYSRQGLSAWLKLPERTLASAWQSEGPHRQGGDAEVRTTTFEYEGETARLLRKTEEPQDPIHRRITEHVYTDEGHLHETWQVNADEQHRRLVSRKHWDARGKHVVCEENALGHVQTYAHHPVLGSVIKTQGPNGLVTATGIDLWGRVHWSRSTNGVWSETEYRRERDQAGALKYPMVIEQRSAGHGRSVQKHNGAGQVVHQRSQQHRGQWVWKDTDFNETGKVSRQYGPYRMRACAEDADLNHPLLEGGAVQGVWCSLDADDVPIVEQQYDDFGRVIEVNHANGTESHVVYNGLEVQKVDALGRIRKERHDALGRVIEVEDPEVRTRAEENEEGMPELVQNEPNESSCVVSYKYDARGRAVRIDVCDETHRTEMRYNLHGQRVWLRTPDSGIETQGYDGYGQLVWAEDALRQRVHFFYDDLGRKVLEVRPEGQNLWTYDTARGASLGKLAESESHDGIKRRFRYDGFGRIAEQQTQIQETEIWSQALTYDPHGRLITEQRGWRNVDDDTGIVEDWRSEGFLQVHYEYESGANNLYGPQLVTVDIARTEGGPRERVWTLEELSAFGQVEQVRYGNGVESHYGHDPETGVLTFIRTGRPNAAILSQDKVFEYDALLQLSSEQDRLFGQEREYGYDELNRLIGVFEQNGSIGKSELYRYDQWGNVLDKQVGDYVRGGGEQFEFQSRKALHYDYRREMAVEQEVFDHQQPHAVRQINVTSEVRNEMGALVPVADEREQWPLSYDALGNLTQYKDGMLSLDYTSFGKPRHVRKEIEAGQQIVYRFDYDAGGSRVQKYIVEEDDQAVEQVRITEKLTQLSGYERLVREDGSTLHTHYVSAPGKGMVGLYKQEEGAEEAELLYAHLGRQGSLDALTNGAGNVIELPRYETGGEPIEGTLNESAIGYTGQRHDAELGLIDMNARYLIPEIHRFASADGVVFDAKNSQAFNRYAYVLNNPFRYTDPSGNVPVEQLDAAVTGGGMTSWDYAPFWIGGYGSRSYYESMVPELQMQIDVRTGTTEAIRHPFFGNMIQGSIDQARVRAEVAGWYSAWTNALVSSAMDGDPYAVSRLKKLASQGGANHSIPLTVAVGYSESVDRKSYPLFAPKTIAIDYNTIRAVTSKTEDPKVHMAALMIHFAHQVAIGYLDIAYEKPSLVGPSKMRLTYNYLTGMKGQEGFESAIDAVGNGFIRGIEKDGMPLVKWLYRQLSPDQLAELREVEPDFRGSFEAALQYANANGEIPSVEPEHWWQEGSRALAYGTEMFTRMTADCKVRLSACRRGTPGYWTSVRIMGLKKMAGRVGIWPNE